MNTINCTTEQLHLLLKVINLYHRAAAPVETELNLQLLEDVATQIQDQLNEQGDDSP